MQRYLLRYSYFGTHFRGSQKQQIRAPPHLWTRPWVSEDRKTVQGALETFLVRLKPVNEPVVASASRTDSGVHALSATACVDLQRFEDGSLFYNPKHITLRLNDYLLTSGINIRIQKTLAVPGNFDPRKSVLSRSYIYKFAVLKDLPKDENARPPFDIDKARAVAELFVGDLNMSGFAPLHTSVPMMRGPDGTRQRIELKSEYFHRHISEFSIVETPSPQQLMLGPLHELYNFYTVKITSKAFFTHQIRRMMWAVFAVANGKWTTETVQRILNDPPSIKTCSNMGLAPPDGLALADVVHDPLSLLEATDNIHKLPVGPEPDRELMKFQKIDWSHSERILEATEPMLGYRHIDPTLYLIQDSTNVPLSSRAKKREGTTWFNRFKSFFIK